MVVERDLPLHTLLEPLRGDAAPQRGEGRLEVGYVEGVDALEELCACVRCVVWCGVVAVGLDWIGLDWCSFDGVGENF